MFHHPGLRNIGVCRGSRVLGLPVLEFLALLTFVIVGAVAVFYHEPWTDEAQAWLIARDLGITGVLHQVGYEGTPPLWYLLLWVLIRLHLPYSLIGAVSLTLMAAAVYVWLRWSPLPLILRLLAPFAFYFQYQYAVVARSYALSTMLAFVAAALWRAKPVRIMPLAFALALLAQTNLYGFAMAVGIAMMVAIDYLLIFRKQRPARRELLPLLLAATLILGSLVTAKIFATPPADCAYGATKLGERLQRLHLLNLPGADALFTALRIADPWGKALLWLAMLWLILLKKRRCVLPYLMTMAAMGLIWWLPQHAGMALAAFLVSLWAAWPEKDTPEVEFWGPALKASLALLLILQLPLTVAAVRNEIRAPYSGAKAAAEFMKGYIGKRPLYAFESFRAGLLPYFPRNVFANEADVSFWRWHKRPETLAARLLTAEMPDDAVVVYRSQMNLRFDLAEFLLNKRSWRKTHSFCGRLFWFDTWYADECYDFYEKQISMPPAQPSPPGLQVQSAALHGSGPAH